MCRGLEHGTAATPRTLRTTSCRLQRNLLKGILLCTLYVIKHFNMVLPCCLALRREVWPYMVTNIMVTNIQLPVRMHFIAGGGTSGGASPPAPE